tara:strand:- start:548 stop:1939 length:1392 start_codon:yes stop_codon:yes gene_type:complete
MGGKNSGPDFGDVAASQGEENEGVIRDQIYANRPTQYTPWGATSWESNPYTDAQGNTTEQWTQTTSLSPELQDVYNKQMAIQGGRTDIAGMLTGRMGSEFGQTMDWTGLNPLGQRPTAQYTLPEEVNRQLDYGGIKGINDPSQQMNMSYGGVSGVDDPYKTRQAAEDAVYRQAQSRIAPQQESQRAALEIRMRNQGLAPGDNAWQSQMESQGNKFNDQNNQALWSANQAGQAEAGQMFGQQMDRRNMGTGELDRMGQFTNDARSNLFGMQSGMRNQFTGERDSQANYFNQAGNQAYNQALGANQQNWNQSMQGSQYANQIRQQQITEAMTKRGFSLNEINALLSGQQVGMPSMPNFSQAGAAQPAPLIQGAAQQASMDNANDPTQALIGAAGTIAGAKIGASDRRLKYNIKRIGTNKGHPWYSYNLKTDGSAHEGVMADEIPAKFTIDMGGITLVDYGRLLGE